MQPRDPETIRARLYQAGVRANKELGQHFLADFGVIEAALDAAQVQKSDTVVEVGPGLGVLSEALLQAGAKVTAFEVDPIMVQVLQEDLPGLQVVAGDVLQTAPPVLEALGSYKVVANIPYQISSPLLRLFLERTKNLPISLTLLIQKEVGERLIAPAKASERGFLSVLVELLCKPRLVAQVPPTAFTPPPAVDSVVIHLEVRPVHERLVSSEMQARFLKFVKAAFTGRRKQLRNVLAGLRGVSASEMGAVFERLGLPTTARAQELTLEAWVKLYTELYPAT